jgi:heme oxygenase
MEVQTTGIMARLREETREDHEHSERRPLERALFAGTLPRDRYVAMLGQRYLIHGALETALLRWRGQDAVRATVVCEELMQAPQLCSDLRYFGCDPRDVRAIPPTTRFVEQLAACGNSSRLLGALYVLEGSKNGARIVAPRVRKAYGLPDGAGTAYLDPHGPQQRAYWERFKQAMDALPLSEHEADEIVAMARRTFAAFAEIDDALYPGE